MDKPFVRATEVVLAGLVDGVHEFEMYSHEMGWTPPFFNKETNAWSFVSFEREQGVNGLENQVVRLGQQDRIRATNEAALEYLLKFTTEGVEV